jgi:dockerin type I repeat protein
LTLFRARSRGTRTQGRLVGILTAAVSGMVCLPALATDYHWNVADGTWNNGPNWNPFGEPLMGDNAFVDYLNGTCDVIGPIGTPANVEVYNHATLNLVHNGFNDGYIQATGDVYVGDRHDGLFGTPGTLNVFGRQGIQLTGQGHLTVGGTLTVFTFSTVNQSGGTVTIVGSSFPDLNISSGTYNLSGGTLTAPFAGLAFGTMFVSGSSVASFGAMTDNGFLSQSGGQILVGTSPGGFTVNGGYFLQGGTFTCGAMTVTENNSAATVSYTGGSMTTGALSLDGGQMSLGSGGGKVLRSTSISIASDGNRNGGLDLSDNAMIVDYTGSSPLATIQLMIAAGTFNTANGRISDMVSSTAVTNASSHKTGLGYGEASALGLNSFNGQSVDTTSVLIAYTWLGDANLDGKVNALDFNRLATNFGKTPGSDVWTQGDFNYDGNVNTLDFTFLASNFNQPAISSAALETMVPEPVMLGFAIIVGLWDRRRMV